MKALALWVFWTVAIIAVFSTISCGADDDDAVGTPDDYVNDDFDDDVDDDAQDDGDDNIDDDSDDDGDDDQDDDTDDDLDDDLDDDADDDFDDDDADDDVDDDIDDDIDDDVDDDIDDDADDDADDDSSAWPPIPCFRDQDMDGRGLDDVTRIFDDGYCPLGWSDRGGESDDTERTAWTGAPELPDDGIDQDAIDGDLAMSDETGVFVARTGDDANPGTMAEPKLTVGAGVALAESFGKVVFVAEGEYEESVATTTSIFGGYEVAGWTRDIDAHVTKILAVEGWAVNVNADAVVAVEGLWLEGAWSYAGGECELTGLLTEPGSHVTAVRCRLDGGTVTAPAGNAARSTGVKGLGEILAVENVICGGHAVASNGSNAIGLQLDDRGYLFDNDIDGGYSDWGNSAGVMATGAALSMSGNKVSGGEAYWYNVTTYGIHAADDIVTILIDNTIDGGTAYQGSSSFGSDVATGVDVTGAAVVVNNVIDGGEGVGFTAPDSSVAVGLKIDAHAPSYVINNRISGGMASSSSGYDFAGTTGVSTSGPVRILHNNIFAGNAIGDISSLIGLFVSGRAIVVNNIIEGSGSVLYNHVLTAIDLGDAADVTLLNTDLFVTASFGIPCLLYVDVTELCIRGLADVNACLWGGCTQATGNISDNPLYDVAGHLGVGSPCIDEGAVPTAFDPEGLTDHDFEGDARPALSGYDIGVDEFTP